jgi:hypothetical protein
MRTVRGFICRQSRNGIGQLVELGFYFRHRGFQARQAGRRHLGRDTRQQIALTAGFGAQALHDLVE